MNTSTLTYNLATKLCSGQSFSLSNFYEKGGCNEVFFFTHRAYFYSYPEFGKSWTNGNSCEYHRVETVCHICKEKPERNYAGVGSMWLLHNGVSDNKILSKVGEKVVRGKVIPILNYVPNTPRLSRMILLCDQHIGSYFKFNDSIMKHSNQTTQLSLF